MKVKKATGATVAYSELTPPPKFVSTLSNYAAQGFDVVIGHGFQFGSPIMKVAPKYPKTKFINILGIVNKDGKQKNVRVLQMANWKSAYVAGALAGLMTKKNRVGMIGGFPFPSIVAQMEGFRLGVKAVNPKVKTTGVYINSFEDLSKAKESALAQVSAGADLLYQVADHAGLAVVKAAQSKGVMAIGNGFDQHSVAPKAIIATHLVNYGGTFIGPVEEYLKNGTFKPGVYLYPLESGGIHGISGFHNNVPPSVQKRVLQVKEDVMSGKIKVPFIAKPKPNN
jgi:basic membrane protein A